MRKILQIEVDCDEYHCYSCEYGDTLGDIGDICWLFYAKIENGSRCKACKEAER